jgi:glycosyltransferase involved in cell wall biosynthesis
MGPSATLTTPPAPGPQAGSKTGAFLPRISIVTPSFNQGSFLGETIESVLSQGYPDLEFVVVDGGSTDDSAAIIRRHEKHLAWWVSEKDAGQYDAINKGFARTSGEVMAWLNSDDKYTPWALAVVGEIFAQLPEVQWLTTLLPLHWDARGLPVRCKPVHGYTKDGFFRGQHLQRPGEWDKAFIQQESTFWRRSLWEKAGGKVDAASPLAGDFELWARFYQHADLYGVPLPLGGFRMHGDQKTAHRMQAYLKEAEEILVRFGGRVEPAATPSRGSTWWRRAFGSAPAPQYKVCMNHDGRWTVASRWL